MGSADAIAAPIPLLTSPLKGEERLIKHSRMD